MKVQNVLKTLGDSGCLLLCYCKLAGVELIDLINSFPKLVLNGIVRDDAYVNDADKLMKFFGKDYKVRKVSIDTIKPGQEYVALWENGRNGHFVIMKDDKVIYNTLEFSYCVKYGKMNSIVRVLE